MAKYIDADKLINTINTLAYPVSHDYGFASIEAGMTVVGIQQVLDEQPAADVVEVKHGRWEHLGGDEWFCTACAHVITTEGSWERPWQKYCEECGAKMDEVE